MPKENSFIYNALVPRLRKNPQLLGIAKKMYDTALYASATMATKFRSIKSATKHAINFCTSPFYRAHQRWLRDDGENKLRYEYPLGPESIVFDAGGFKGEWAENINRRFGSSIFVFEPVSEFCTNIHKRLGNCSAATILQYGISDKDSEQHISLMQDASSLFQKGTNTEVIKLRDITSVLTDLGINHVDLNKINIEGGEFPLLQRMIETGDIHKFSAIQVQFHLFVPLARLKYARLAKELRKTHTLVWRYPFVWESWQIKKT